MLQRIALYATLGAVLMHLGHVWDTWGFWCILALYWCSEAITRREAYQMGIALGAHTYKNMTADQRAKIDQLLNDIEHKD
jgi:hypothetical protein